MKKLFFVLGLVSILLSACSSSDDMPEASVPEITLDSETGIYTVKTGRQLTIAPTYRHVGEATVYVWTVEGVEVCRTPSYTFESETPGEVFVDLKVSNGGGRSAQEELRIDVVEAEVPVISYPEAEKGFTVVVNSDLMLTPDVAKTSVETTYAWSVDGEKVSSEKDYTFRPGREATYRLKFETRNEDGSDTLEFEVRACAAENMPLKWVFDRKDYNLSSGRKIRLAPCVVENASSGVYTWTVNGTEKQQGSDMAYVFAETAEGSYRVEVTLTQGDRRLSELLTVNVCPKEGTFRRTASAASRADFDKVYSFLPAPGQFINEGYSCATAEEAAAKAGELLRAEKYVSLGSFGGEVVVGFDHSVENGGDYDFMVRGNSFEGSSEPGIVWVMQDENGDGKPNDTWYELKGSEYGKPETMQDYAVTYFRPRAAKMDVQWVDNRGNRGQVKYMGEFHRQDSYYPEWVEGDSYTLRGTCLAPRNHVENGIWINGAYDWGYADNASTTDMAEGRKGCNRFRISDAVTFDGRPAQLQYIDFVKVQCGVNARSGQIGEISTEVVGFTDCHLTK